MTKVVRNPVITYNNLIINTIGDPHLGRVFKNVLKTVLGDRERKVFEDFKSRLYPTNSPDFIVVMGDLFDKTNISNNVLYHTIKCVDEASVANPDITYIYLARQS
jgi:DNA repair exonuclease SbcCD nuclease subunit